MEPILTFEHVDIFYEDNMVIQDLNFEVYPGEILGLVGDSGCGKSSILKSILGILDAPGLWKGEIRFMGQKMTEASQTKLREIRGADIGMIFQDTQSSLNPVHRVGTQIVQSVRAHEGISKMEIKKRAYDLLEQVGFREPDWIWNSYPFQLSGGMCQRVGIVLAMLLNPSLLLADEPTSALDVIVQKQVLNLLREMQRCNGTAMVLVSHDRGVISYMADRIVDLSKK